MMSLSNQTFAMSRAVTPAALRDYEITNDMLKPALYSLPMASFSKIELAVIMKCRNSL